MSVLSHVFVCFVADVVLAGSRVGYTCMLVVQREESVGGEEQAACRFVAAVAVESSA